MIPVSVREGSGKLSGSLAENQHILVAMDAGTYNVRKATCVFRCITCNGAVSFTVAANPFAVAVSGTSQMSMKARWNTGSTYDVTSASDWSSSNTSVATVDQTALAHGISVGGATLSAFDYSEPLGGQDCNYYPSCANDMAVGGGGSSPGNVTPVITSVNPTFLNDGDTGKSVTIHGAGFGASPKVNLPQGVSSNNQQDSTDSTIVLPNVSVAASAYIGANSITVTVKHADK